MELRDVIEVIIPLIIILAWIIYKIFTSPIKTKRFIFETICQLSLIVGSYSIFYWIYTLFVGGFDLRGLYYFTVIPLTIGSSIRGFDNEDYPFWEQFKNRLTITGYLIVLGGIIAIMKSGFDGQIHAHAPSIFLPIIIGSVPILIDIYLQEDNENN
jgi:hypothetical protein